MQSINIVSGPYLFVAVSQVNSRREWVATIHSEDLIASIIIILYTTAERQKGAFPVREMGKVYIDSILLSPACYGNKYLYLSSRVHNFLRTIPISHWTQTTHSSPACYGNKYLYLSSRVHNFLRTIPISHWTQTTHSSPAWFSQTTFNLNRVTREYLLTTGQ